MRVFAAIDLDDAARDAISAEQQRIAAAVENTRTLPKWVHSTHVHLTLAFLGEISAPDADRVIAAMSPPIDVESFTLTFAGPGVFPTHGAPRVLWLGVAEGSGEVSEVHRQVVSRLREAGVVLERRPFQPHLTLGRWRVSRPADAARVLAAARSGSDEAVARVVVREVVLVHSRLSPAGPAYTTLTRANLTACRP